MSGTSSQLCRHAEERHQDTGKNQNYRDKQKKNETNYLNKTQAR